MDQLEEHIVRICSKNDIKVSILQCEICEYFGGMETLFTRYSCMHPKLQKLIDENIKKLNTRLS